MTMGLNTIYNRSLICLLAFLASSCMELDKETVAPPVEQNQRSNADPSLQMSMSSSDLWIYQDALQSPWINASWSATITFNSTEQSYNGTSSIKTALTSAWGALSLHYDYWWTPGISPSSYASLDFAVYAPSSGTMLSVFAENDQGQSFPKVNYGTIPANQWTTISVTMSQLSPNGQTINRIAIQEISGVARTFYVDDLRFSGTTTGSPPPAPTLLLPANGATNVQTNPTLSWNASSGAASYRLQLSGSSLFTSTIIDQSNITVTSHSVSGLSYSTTYYWRVNASNSFGTSDWSSVSSFTTTTAPDTTRMPDLTVDANRLKSSLQIRWRNFGSSSCAVVEGCVTSGYRKLLRFDVLVPNLGEADLIIGYPADPRNSGLFQWSPCHGHYHFEGFAEYRLLSNSQRIVTGRKQAFCLMDAVQYWSGSRSRGYDCDYQGISVGWADLYDRYTDCQWIDITNVRPGNYILEVEVNVGGKIAEGDNAWPNIVQVPVKIQ